MRETMKARARSHAHTDKNKKEREKIEIKKGKRNEEFFIQSEDRAARKKTISKDFFCNYLKGQKY